MRNILFFCCVTFADFNADGHKNNCSTKCPEKRGGHFLFLLLPSYNFPPFKKLWHRPTTDLSTNQQTGRLIGKLQFRPSSLKDSLSLVMPFSNHSIIFLFITHQNTLSLSLILGCRRKWDKEKKGKENNERTSVWVKYIKTNFKIFGQFFRVNSSEKFRQDGKIWNTKKSYPQSSPALTDIRGTT